MTHAEDKIRSMLYRKFCPSSTELGEYQLGLLSEGQAASIRQHLADCPHCYRELKQLQTYLEDLSPELEGSLLERIKVWVAERLPDLEAGGPGLTPAFGLRGEGEQVQVYQAGEAQLTLQVEEELQQSGLRSLVGLVVGAEPSGLRATLWQAGEQRAATEVDELGNFYLSELEPGSYALTLIGPEVEIHVQELEIE